MSSTERNQRDSSIQRRVLLAFLLLSLLVFVSSGSGLWLSTSAGENIQTAQGNVDQVERLIAVQKSWMSATILIDNILLSRSTELTEGQLNTQVDDLNRQLSELSDQPFGRSTVIAENQVVAEDLQQAGAELRQTIDELLVNITDNNWSAAENLRFTRIAALQRSAEDALDKLLFNINSEASAVSGEASRTQNASRVVFMTAALLSLLATSFLSLGIARTIVHPVNLMVTQVEQVAHGDFSPLPPLDQGDEVGRLSRALAHMADALRQSYESLETRVDERSRNLERRSAQIQAASLVARDVSNARRLDELLDRAANLIMERFGFYHAGIFLIDERSEFAVLRAATGEAGRAMLARGHQLKVGEAGIVGFVTGSGQPRIALDVGSDAVHFRNPLLPETRSEMALPLKVSEQVIGALDVQSREASAFSEDDVTILQIMADQLAVAIENARLFQQVQDQLKALESFYSQYGSQAWEKIKQSSPVVGYRFERGVLTPVTPQQGNDEQPTAAVVRIPLEVRGASIGSIEVWPEQGKLPDEDLELLNAVGERISQALETARLFEEAQDRSNREQMINRMTTNLSRSMDMGVLLQTALRELAHLPEVVEVSVHVGPAQARPVEQERPSSNGSHPSPNGGHTAQAS